MCQRINDILTSIDTKNETSYLNALAIIRMHLVDYQNDIQTIITSPDKKKRILFANTSGNHIKLQHLAHSVFDALWQGGSQEDRSIAYAWLNSCFSSRLGTVNGYEGPGHMAKLNVLGCLKVIELCDMLKQQYGGIEGAKTFLKGWNETQRAATQLSTPPAIPLPSEVAMMHNINLYMVDPKEYQAEQNPFQPEKQELTSEECIAITRKDLLGLQGKKKLQTNDKLLRNAVDTVLKEAGIPLPEPRKDRIALILADDQRILAVGNKRITPKVTPKKTVAEVDAVSENTDTQHNNPDRLAGRYQNKPSYIPAPKRPSVKQPDKLERARREEQERKQQEIEKKKRDVEQKPQATFNPSTMPTLMESEGFTGFHAFLRVKSKTELLPLYHRLNSCPVITLTDECTQLHNMKLTNIRLVTQSLEECEKQGLVNTAPVGQSPIFTTKFFGAGLDKPKMIGFLDAKKTL